MNAKLRNGLVMGSALTAIFLSQVACGSGPNVVVPPTATPAESNIETIVFDPATGIGCEKLHDISGAKAAGVSYESFVDELYDNNKSSYGLEFFYPATGERAAIFVVLLHWVMIPLTRNMQ